MNREEAYGAWKDRRKDVAVDAAFADRVMRRVAMPQEPRPADTSQGDRAGRAWRVQAVAALLMVGIVVGLVRAGSVIGFLLLSCTRGY